MGARALLFDYRVKNENAKNCRKLNKTKTKCE
jgi:hypothetical protein